MILKQSLLTFIKTGAIPGLLTIVALRQILLVHTVGLSPWHGGGFGMFASIDRDERRLVTTQAMGCSEARDIMMSDILATSPPGLHDDAYTHIRTFPTTAQLQRMGKLLLLADTQNPNTDINTSDNDAPNQANCAPKIQLQVWRLLYDGQTIDYKPITPKVEVQP